MSILTGTKSAPKERQKKPDEKLASVVRETAVPAAVELLRANEPFVLPGGDEWAMLILDVSNIGGLSKRHKRNEAKGSFIELIESDQIQTVATADMLREEVFGIIPTAETLERMEEYSMLTGVEYIWAKVSVSGDDLQVNTVCNGVFEDALAVSAGQKKVTELFGEQPVTDAGPKPEEPPVVGAVETEPESLTEVSDDDAEDADEPVEDEGDEPLFSDEDEPVFADAADDEPIYADEPEQSFPEGAEEPAEEEPIDPVEAESADEVAEPEPAEEQEPTEYWSDDDDADDVEEPLAADQDQVRDTIARRFLGDDLGLAIDLSEFYTSFNVGAPTVSIDLPKETSDWLGGQIAQLTRQANAEIARLHADGQEQLQTEYINLMSLCAKDIIKEVATDRPGSVFKDLLDQAETDHRAREADKDTKVALAQRGIREEYEAQAAKVGEQARLQAETQYSDRNKPRLTRELTEAEGHVVRALEDAYSHDQAEILRLRRKIAEQRMFVGQTKVFEVLSERQEANLAAERDLLSQWTEKISQIISDNRSEDINRAQALAEQQSRFDEVGTLRDEHEKLIERTRSEHADRLRRMEEEIERTKAAAVEQLRNRDEEWQHALSIEKEQTASQTARVSDLLEQQNLMSQTFQKQYDDRINEFEADKRKTHEVLDRATWLHERSNKIMMLLFACIGVAMCGVGFILGATLL